MWSKIVDFVNRIDAKYFDIKMSEFEHFESINQMNSIPKIFFAIGVGMMLALILAYYHKSMLGSIVRYLSEENADSPDKALPLDSKKVKNKRLILRALEKDNSLNRYIGTVYKKDDKGNVYRECVEERKYYLKKELRKEAERRYKGSSADLIYLIFGLIAIFAITVTILNFRYEIAKALNFLLGLLE